jgi:rubrerythrin
MAFAGPDGVRQIGRVNIATSLENPKLGQDAIVLYDALAEIERDERRAAAFRHIASNERRHAAIWEEQLRRLGATVPPAGRPRARIRFIITLARLFGTRTVSNLVKAVEGDEEAAYGAQEVEPAVVAIAADEREHAEIWKRLDDEAKTAKGRGKGGRGSPAQLVGAGGHPGIEPGAPQAADSIARGERWHRSGRSGTLRATIFGVSDGLTSNLSLVMGVAGASGHRLRFGLNPLRATGPWDHRGPRAGRSARPAGRHTPRRDRGGRRRRGTRGASPGREPGGAPAPARRHLAGPPTGCCRSTGCCRCRPGCRPRRRSGSPPPRPGPRASPSEPAARTSPRR